jgi:hypothetical protein
VCGDLIDYVDPTSERSILGALRKAITDEGYRHRREQAIKQAKLRTWQQVADAVFGFITQR